MSVDEQADYMKFACLNEQLLMFLCTKPQKTGVFMSIDEKSTYYDQGGIETIEIIKAKLTKEQFIGYLLGNIIKYSCRRNWKGQARRDDEKVDTYAGILNGFCNEDAGLTED